MSIARELVKEFQQEAAGTRRFLEAVPFDKSDWKPHEKSMTLGQLAGHVAEMPGWAGAMLEDAFDLAASGEEYTPYTAADRNELLSTFDKNIAALDGLLAERDDAFMTATWRMLKAGHEVMALPRAAAMRSVLIHHLIHHRGQLSVYLRLLGVAVPPVYGPTADFPEGF